VCAVFKLTPWAFAKLLATNQACCLSQRDTLELLGVMAVAAHTPCVNSDVLLPPWQHGQTALPKM
jgi:hypothetical protein